VEAEWTKSGSGRVGDDGRDLGVRAGAHEVVHLGHLPRHLVVVALGEAAGHHELLAAPLLLVARQLEDGLDRLLLGALDEAAGVDDDDVGAGGVLHQPVAGLGQGAEHDLAVHPVLRAAERVHVDGSRHGAAAI
jgi:hypothetical protein